MGAPEEASPDECTIQNGFIKNGLVAASLGAGAIHVWAAWAHYELTRVLVFFVLVATVQLWLGAVILLVRSVPWSMLIGGAVANAAVVVTWVLSRTTGVPGMPKARSMDEIMDAAMSTPGPSKGYYIHGEGFGLYDTTASLLQVAFVVGVLMLVRKRRRCPAGESGIDATVAVGTGVPEDS